MSYPTMPPPARTPAVAPASPAGRPPVVSVAAVLLWVMASIGLIYAIATIAVVPGTVSRFRAAIDGTTSSFEQFNGGTDPDTYVAVVWLGAAVGLALGVILFALYVVLGVALRRGSNVARVTTLVCCGLGAVAGAGALIAVALQRSGDGSPFSVGEQLSQAYPSGWLGLNVTLAAAQILAYGLVAILILAAPRVFFRRAASLSPPSTALPRYGSAYPPAPGYGPASGYPAISGYPQPAPAPGYGPTPVFGRPDPASVPSAAGPDALASAPPALGGYGPASAPPALGGYGPASAPPTVPAPPAPDAAGPASAPPAPGTGPYPPGPGAVPYPPGPGAVPYPPGPGAVPYPPQAPGYGPLPAAGPWATPAAYGYSGPPVPPVPGAYGPPAYGPGYPVAPPGNEPGSDWARPSAADPAPINPEQPPVPAASPSASGDGRASAGGDSVERQNGAGASEGSPAVSEGGSGASEGGSGASEGGSGASEGGSGASEGGPGASEGGSGASEGGPAAGESALKAGESGSASPAQADSEAQQPAGGSPFARPAGLDADRSFAPTGDTGAGEPPNRAADPGPPTGDADDDFWARPAE